MIRTQLGSSSSIVFDSSPTVEDFLEALANERLRHMPHDGSNWDKVLRWAENIGGHVLIFHEAVHDFMLNSEDATRLIWGSCLSLLQMGPSQISILTKAFGVFHRMILAMSVFIRQRHLLTASTEIRRELAHTYSDFMQLTCAVNAHYRTKSHGKHMISATEFEEHFGETITGFYHHLDRISTSMWTMEIESSRFRGHSELDICAIRDFLGPQDRIVRNMISNRLSSGVHRAEFTCEWFSSHVTNFTRNRNKVFLITGGPSSGKTVLSRWIVEKLQGSMDQDPYDVISYFVDTNAKYTTSPLSLIKSLLLQILDRKVGHQQLVLKIQDVMEMSAKGRTALDIEQALWEALDLALTNEKIIILIDGLDQISGARIGNPAILDTLHKITSASNRTHVKAIVLSRPLSKAASQLTQHFSIEDEHISDDIRLVIEHSISSQPQFHAMKEKDRKSIIQKVFEGSKSSFLWANLIFQSVKNEKTVSAILDLLDRAPKTVEEVLDRRLASLDARHQETKQILSWVLASERPLTIKEIRELLEIDLDQCAHSPRFTHVEDDIRHACGSLVIMRDGMVYLRHPSIREHLLSATSGTNKSSKLVLNIKEAHHDLTVRALAYVKIHLHGDIEPQFKRMSSHELSDHFAKYSLLEYAARYWTSHFRLSSLYEPSGHHKLSSSFKSCLSSSTILALIEGTCLARQYVAIEAEKLQLLSYSVRKSVFGERSAAVLQSLILQVRICQRLQSSHVSEYSYEAWKISRSVCHITVVLACAEAFIQSTLSIKVTTRTEFIIRKEEVLLYLIKTHKHDHGASHELTIRYITMLAELYVSIQEIEKAAILYRELYEIRIELYGHFHAETIEIYELLISQLKTLSKFEVILELTLEYHEYIVRTLSITDERRIKSTMTLVQIYEERKEVERAEEILVSFWRSITTETSTTTRTREIKIDITLEYSKFLCRHSRKEESEVVLRGLWIEIESYSEEWRSETTVIQRIQVIAEQFRSLKVYSMARSIFSSLWSYYKKTEQHTSTEAITVATSLAETVTETISSSSSSSTTTTGTEVTESTTLTVEEEQTLREVFESSMTSSSTKISSSTVKTCVALSSSYSKQERWSEACEIYSQTISRVWSSIETRQETVKVTEEYSSEVIGVAMSLAHCRFKMLQIEKAEVIYWNIFQSLLHNHKCDQNFLVRTVKSIIEFFETTYRYEKVIKVYQEFYVHLQSSFGKSHACTIEILYGFGTIATRMSRRTEAETAYYQIFSAYQIEHGCLHSDGVQAALLLCEIYEHDHKWVAAQNVYACLWQTFLKHGQSYKLGAEFVERIYSKYMHILEHKTKTEYSVIRQLAVEYRKTCISFYGSHSELTVKATMHLAEISERREEYHEECMSLYEEVIKHSEKISKSMSTTKTSTTTSSISTTSTQTVLHTVKKRLAQLYSSNTTTVTKAVSLYREQFEMHKSQYGYSSTETLTAMKDLVISYKKQSTTESTTIATQLLRTSVTEICEHETHSEKLIESAKTIANVYIECGYKETAIKVIQEMRTKVIEEVKMTQSINVERKSYVFLAAFAEVITETSSFSSIMAELRTEILLYESYFRATKTRKEFFVILESGCRLYYYLKESKRSLDVKIIEEELLEVFIKHLSVSQTVKRTIIQAFFHICLEEVMNGHYELTVIERATAIVLEHTKHSRFQEAYDLAALIDRFIHLQGGFRTEQNIHTGFKLALYLAGRGTLRCEDSKLIRTMIDLSRIILREALEGSETLDFAFTDLPIELLNDLVGLLGEQQNYEDLERILTKLWSSRIVQKTWSSTIVVWIGRRLIETRFCRKEKHNDAIHLCKDIRYNLTRVWGGLDRTTLEFTALLSELYTATNQHRKAMALHEDVLSQIAYGDDEGLSSCDSAAAAVKHAELLKRTYQREGKWDKGLPIYQDLFTQLDRKFAKEKTWTEKAPKGIEKWQAKGADQMGMWSRPSGFEFLVEEKKTETPKKHQYVLRRASSNFAVRQSYANGSASGKLVGSGSMSKNGTVNRPLTII